MLHLYRSGSYDLCCLLVDGFCAQSHLPAAAIKNMLFLAGWVVLAFMISLLSSAKTDRSFKEFLDARNPTKQHSSTLESYLIKPVQRVLKYPLLLRELVSLTDKDSEEHYHLTGTSHRDKHTAGLAFPHCLDVWLRVGYF